jgi:hypothetical protein
LMMGSRIVDRQPCILNWAPVNISDARAGPPCFQMS